MDLPSLSSSCSSFSYGFTNDVFLSFRGSDTRYHFTGNLYKALSDKGIHTFFDEGELKGGDEIKPSLVNAIKESRIAIPVLSENYASSSFCLDELVTIIECVKAQGRLVLPVFYGVDPSHVRHQTGSYGQAIAKHEERFRNNKERCTYNMERLRRWKMALTQVADLSGKHFILGKEYEHHFIGKIVEEVSKKINRAPLHVANYPVGLQSRVLQVNLQLEVGSDDAIHMIGIYGIGGMGKSTLARAIYNFIADQFEHLCFLHNVREYSIKHGLELLQEMLLSETTGLSIKVGDVSEGISIIKQRLHRKKILLVLDDVDKLKQLQVMVGESHWLGPGSRVIITTRDKHLLTSHRIERTYEVHGLDMEEALELLRWQAFKMNEVDSNYEDILKRVVTYASGLPLALEVVGSNLFGKCVEEWRSMLDMYERIPNEDIQNILKVSFDTLQEEEKNVFLDIACCFKGSNLEEVKEILCAHHGHSIKYHLGVLVEKSLIKIRTPGYVTLHDLIEDMGKEIVRQESPKEPGKRSRLWFHADVIEVLEENTGTSQIEIIYMDFPLFGEEVVEWEGDELKKMKSLKTLIIKNGCFSKGPKYLPNSLRVLEWHRYPFPNIPSDFWPKKLSICKLPENCLTSFEIPGSLNTMKFVNMKDINLDRCQCLTQISDVSGFPNLEKFSFQDCENLTKIHDSVGHLNKLKILNAKGCIKLKSFPPLELTSLEKLKLSGCHSLESFPEILRKMEKVLWLNLKDTSIEELPFSFQNLTRLNWLQLASRQSGILRLPSSILMMSELCHIISIGYGLLPNENDELSSKVSSNVGFLNLYDCNMLDEFLPIWFPNVIKLVISSSSFTILPECLKECRSLSYLYLYGCEFLREIRGIPPNLRVFSALDCESLTSTSRSLLLNQEPHEAGSPQLRLSGTAMIPEWFEHQSRGTSISFWFRNKFPSVDLFLVCKSMDNPDNKFHIFRIKLIINGREYDVWGPEDFYGSRFHLNIKTDHTYVFDLMPCPWDSEYEDLMPFLKPKYKLDEALLKNEWIHVEVKLMDFWRERSPIIESGIHVYKQKSNMEDIRFTNPFKKRKLDDDDDMMMLTKKLKMMTIHNTAEL